MTDGEPPVEELALHTADGLTLEAELAVPADAWAAAVLAHPHPQQGGSMRSIVTGTQFRQLPGAGVAVLRFNFRGVERSEGAHDHGRGEQIDITAAIDALHAIVEGLPLVLAGWSFGADTALAVGDARLGGWVAVAPPLRTLDLTDLVAAHDPRPKVIVVPEHDQFRSPDAVREITAGWANTTVTVAPGTGHFLVGQLDAAVDAVTSLLRTLDSDESP